MKLIRKIKDLLNYKIALEYYFKRVQFDNRAALINHSLFDKLDKGVSSEKYVKEEIIISLTTYGKRLNDVYLTIESLLSQSLKSNRIILWLAKDIENKTLPLTLQSQIKRGLEVKYCEDIRSYKKLIPTLKLYPNDVIITVDDDVIYDFDLVERLVNHYKENPSYIYFCRGHKMVFDKQNNIDKYDNWEFAINHVGPSKLNFPTGVGGVLYPPNCFDERVLDQEIFMKYCPSADDVWFKAMSLLNNVSCYRIETRNIKGEDYSSNEEMQSISLNSFNVKNGGNDIQIKNVFSLYNMNEYL